MKLPPPWQWPGFLCIFLIRCYQLTISPWLPPSCRFAPTCSTYAMTAVRRFGLVRGGWLAVCRIARCHPFHPGGYDPVPERTPAGKTSGAATPHPPNPTGG